MMSPLLAESYGRVASVLVELGLYWPGYSVSADFVADMIRTVFAI